MLLCAVTLLLGPARSCKSTLKGSRLGEDFAVSLISPPLLSHFPTRTVPTIASASGRRFGTGSRRQPGSPERGNTARAAVTCVSSFDAYVPANHRGISRAGTPHSEDL